MDAKTSSRATAPLTMRVALEWFASEQAWEVTPKSMEDNRFGFNAPPYSIYATPWGFARAALASNRDKGQA